MRNAVKAGEQGYYNEKMDTHIFTPEVWVLIHPQGQLEPEEPDSEE